MKSDTAASQAWAETFALEALAWIASDDDMMGRFLGATGTTATDLRAMAGDPHFLGSVLDFLLMEDHWVIAFCDTANRPYTDVGRARAALPGGEQVHWT